MISRSRRRGSSNFSTFHDGRTLEVQNSRLMITYVIIFRRVSNDRSRTDAFPGAKPPRRKKKRRLILFLLKGREWLPRRQSCATYIYPAASLYYSHHWSSSAPTLAVDTLPPTISLVVPSTLARESNGRGGGSQVIGEGAARGSRTTELHSSALHGIQWKFIHRQY